VKGVGRCLSMCPPETSTCGRTHLIDPCLHVLDTVFVFVEHDLFVLIDDARLMRRTSTGGCCLQLPFSLKKQTGEQLSLPIRLACLNSEQCI
jgi:hypothetical protein